MSDDRKRLMLKTIHSGLHGDAKMLPRSNASFVELALWQVLRIGGNVRGNGLLNNGLLHARGGWRKDH